MNNSDTDKSLFIPVGHNSKIKNNDTDDDDGASSL